MRGAAEPFGIEELDRRVAEREGGASSARAHEHAAAVLSVVLDAVSPGERSDVLAQLPTEIAALVTR